MKAIEKLGEAEPIITEAKSRYEVLRNIEQKPTRFEGLLFDICSIVDQALALLCQPEGGEIKRLIQQVFDYLSNTMHPTPKVSISNILSKIEVLTDRQAAELKDKEAEIERLKNERS